MHRGRRWQVASLLATALALAFDAHAAPAGAEARREALVTVTGEAEVRVVPDIVELAFGVETHSADLEQARAASEEVVKRVLVVAEGFGIAPGDRQTDHIALEPWHERPYGDSRGKLMGYFARRTVVLICRDPARFEELVTKTLATGVNYLHGVTFRTSELRKHRDHARRLAMELAREKAELLTKEAGRKLGRAHTIQEYPGGGSYVSYGGYWGSRWSRGGSQASVSTSDRSIDGGSLALGQISVTAQLNVTFEME